MPKKCVVCGKEVKWYNPEYVDTHKADASCKVPVHTGKCWMEFQRRQKELEIQKRKDKEMKKQFMMKEFKCTCNQCNHVWHYLERDEKALRSQATANAMMGCGMLCNPFGALFSNKARDLHREIEKFNRCPKCGTGNITKEVIYYEKKT